MSLHTRVSPLKLQLKDFSHLLSNPDLGDVHARAIVYDNRVEFLWTYAQVASAMMMSIAHGSNDGM